MGQPLTMGVTVVLALVAMALGGPLVKLVFGLVDRSPSASVVRRGDTSLPAVPDEHAAVLAAGSHLRGGTWIGLLERLAVFVSLMAAWPEGIAITLAVKGLARYPELRATTSGTAERFIIGTFTSVLWAAACAGVAWWVRPLLG